MPDDEAIAQMYGTNYAGESTAAPDAGITDPKEPEKVKGWLSRLSRGTFLDYGCGAGNLLTMAKELGWHAIGVEYDSKVASQTAQHTGTNVLTVTESATLKETADVLHLGDVIEHLTKLESQFPEILRLLKPGGTLIAQGPLEANFTFFNEVLKVSRQLRGSPRSNMAPYHVLLATADGQATFFRRHGLEPIEYTLSEPSWPAPQRLSMHDLVRPRKAGLFIARKLSQALTWFRPNHWGSRFFYVGKHTAI